MKTDDERYWRGQVASRNTPSAGNCVMIHLGEIAAWWVPHALTEIQRWLRYAYAPTTLQDGDRFLSRIIAIDEFWARTYEPELKRQSAGW
ncbi:hypothetical protein TNIN_224331 [Trichonephila inaurata madagascariensis]|uniref:Uncharacterized protein n=1 Tax=Trichonephila inaurata madagascariensis TaxID=2747483 RepID=A0A8X6Y7L6_9ARAC|nr:hypothetical protein TNIN_224331 [Trichonephila inaurata madagascariensis]